MSQDLEPGRVNFVRDQAQDLPVVATKEICEGGTYIVTGANTGLGYEAVKHFVSLSAGKVILAARTLSRGEDAKARIEAETGIKNVAEVWELEMGSYDSIKAFAAKVNQLERVDAIIENAAVALDKWAYAEGQESTLTINVTGTMLLAGLVLPKLEESAKKFGIVPHLSLVGSAVAFSVHGKLEEIGENVDTLDYLNDEERGLDNDRYPLSKQLLFYAFQEYSVRKPVSSTGVVISYVNPGLCKTELSRHVDEAARAPIEAMKNKIGRTAEKGSRTLLHGAVGGKDIHGKYLSECEVKQHYIPFWVSNESGQSIQERVWESIAAHVNKVAPGCL